MQNKLPEFFRSLFWDADFEKINSEKDAAVIVERTINYGDLPHWQFVVRQYGKEKIRRIVSTMPASTFRPQALRLAELLLGVSTRHALRSADR